MDTHLKQKMYVFVEKHLSPMDKGIQAAHSIVEYYNEALLWDKERFFNSYNAWAHLDKTIILLNGGCVDDLEKLINILTENKIHCGIFREPDLDNIVTAVSIIADERVFDTEKYPEFDKWISTNGLMTTFNKSLADVFTQHYLDYLNFIGGQETLILRDLINKKQLAK